MTAPPGPKVGRSLLRVDPGDWSAHPVGIPDLHRPIDVLSHPDGRHVLVLDFGRFEMLGQGKLDADAGSGAVWSIGLD